jgi:aldose 1-epimerase
MPPEPHSIHGDGWRAAWRVELAEPARAVLAHAPADTPFPDARRQIFELSEDGLNATLEITNTGAGRVPMGFGHHPYFPRTEGLTLEMAAASVWMPDARKLPARKVAVPDAWNFASPTRLSPLDLDHDFTDRHGPILMHWPENGLRLAIDSDPLFAHTVVYVPPERDFVCVEPVSHLANAVNLAPVGVADTGLRILAPGETFSGSMRFRVTS